MPQTIPDLWPAEFGEMAILMPVAILRQQAAALGHKTQHIVRGVVQTQADGDEFRHTFSLYCDPLGYSIALFHVLHPVLPYPARIIASGIFDAEEPVEVANPDELLAKLREIFKSNKTVQTIQSLLAQAKQ